MIVSDRVDAMLAFLPVNRLLIASAEVFGLAQKIIKGVNPTIFLQKDANNYEYDINSEVIH